MDIVTDRRIFQLENRTATTIGKFDGIHIGHRKLLDEILEQKKKGLKACVFTFETAPAVLFAGADGKELTTRAEKRRMLQRMGVDILIEFPLNQETAAMDPILFVEQVLWKQMKCSVIAAGIDLSFGAGGAGNRELLENMGERLGFEVKIIDKVRSGEEDVSSTYVRTLLEEGKMTLVKELLGMPYTVSGKVVHGNEIGRTLSMPTANLVPDKNKLLPPNGVYYSSVRYKGREYPAISNIGYKPTVSQDKALGIESYLYDFEADMYGAEIEVSLYEFRRPERKFVNREELKAVMEEDMEAGRKYEGRKKIWRQEDAARDSR